MDARQTAAAIARVRTREGSRPRAERLFEDPYAAVFDDMDVDVQELFDRIPFFEEHIRLRTRFFDDAVRDAVATFATHVILVGAGFDTRALRMPELGAPVHVVEVDHADQIERKRARLAAAGIVLPDTLSFATADLMEEGALARALEAAGLSAPVVAVWICEGLLGYLSMAAIEQLAATAGRFSARGSVLVANHNIHSWSPAALAETFTARGWTVTPAPSFATLHRKWIGPTPDSTGSEFALLVAERRAR